MREVAKGQPSQTILATSRSMAAATHSTAHWREIGRRNEHAFRFKGSGSSVSKVDGIVMAVASGRKSTNEQALQRKSRPVVECAAWSPR